MGINNFHVFVILQLYAPDSNPKAFAIPRRFMTKRSHFHYNMGNSNIDSFIKLRKSELKKKVRTKEKVHISVSLELGQICLIWDRLEEIWTGNT